MKKRKVIIWVVVILVLAGGVTAGILGICEWRRVTAIEEAVAELAVTPGAEEQEEDGQVDLATRLENTSERYQLKCEALMGEMQSILETQALDQLLAPANYAADGPEFTESRRILGIIEARWQALYKRWLYLSSSEGIMSELRKGVSPEEESFLFGDYQGEIKAALKHDRDTFSQTNLSVSNMFDDIESVFGFLSDHRGEWEVEGEDLYFTSDELVHQYEALLEE